MAEPSAEQRQPQQQQQMGEEKLRYLDFVHLAVIQALLCCVRLYDLAKDNSGPLKPGVQTVEGTVKTVVGPVYNKFHHVPYELLKFVDRKLDDSMSELERRVPVLMQQASSKACGVANKVPQVARSVASEVQRARAVDNATCMAKAAIARYEPTAKELYAKYEPTAKELYDKYEPMAEHYAVMGWLSLNRIPVFAQMARVVVPTAAHLSEKYNGAVCMGREKGYGVAACLPSVPVEKIGKLFGPPGAADGVVSLR